MDDTLRGDRLAAGSSWRVLARSGAVLGAATLLANVLGYALVLAVSRLVSPSEYGAVAALLNLSVVGVVPALAVQLVAARRTAARTASGGDPRLGVLGLAAGGAAGLVVVLAAPLLEEYLHLGGPWPAVALGASLVPAGGVSAVQGVLQGGERFGRLALVLVVAAGTRCAAGAGAAAAGRGVTGVLAGTCLAAAVTLAVAVAVAPGAFGLSTRGHPAGEGWGALVRDVAGSSTSTAGLLAFVNLDVLLARHGLPAAASGVYAVGSIFAKVTFWGPAFLATLLYPRMRAGRGRDRAVAGAVGLSALAGASVVVVCAVAGGRLVGLVSGPAYVELGRTVALFAALGTAFAVVQVLVYARVAVGDHRLGWTAWVCGAATAAAVVGLHPPTVGRFVLVVLAGAVALAVAGLAGERGAVGVLLRGRARS